MRKLAYVLLGVLVVLLVIDRVGHYAATQVLDSRIEEQLGQEVETSIGGFPFLTQAAFGRWTSVRVTADAMPVPGVELTATDVRAEAKGVRGYTAEEARAESARLRLVVPYGDIEKHAELPAGTLSGTEDGRVRATTTQQLPGGSLGVTGTGVPEVSDGFVSVRPDELTIGGGSVQLSDQARSEIQDRLRWRLPLDDLPPGLRVEEVKALPKGLEMTVTGQDVLLSDVLTG